MKKLFLSFLSLLVISYNAIAQRDNLMMGYRLDSMQIAAIKAHRPMPFGSHFHFINSKIPMAIKLNPLLTYYQSAGIKSGKRHFQGFFISDSTAATIVMINSKGDDLKNYRYHVVIDDSVELVHWSVPKPYHPAGEDDRWPYALLGNFKVLGKLVIIEVVNIKDYSTRSGIVLDWRVNHKPVVTQLNATAYYSGFTITKQHNHRYAKKFDDVTGLPLDLKFPVSSITQLSFTFKDHESLPYEAALFKDSSGVKRLLMREKINDNQYDFQTEKYNKPGKYELQIYPFRRYDNTKVIHLPFEIVPRIEEKVITAQQLWPYILTMVSLFAGGYLYNRQKLRKANRERTIANLKLSSVRSQLNPHFMFNALTSIQNLMNQQDNEGANHYLSKFAGLTRQVLNASGRELISLEDELQIITDYLQMEQLRFGFEYTITVDKTINKANIEIPTMLLQPFIENAAKHGVSALQSKGKIEVVIMKNGLNNLILTIADNGPGFGDKADNEDGGYGLKLSDDRIMLLNQIYRDQHIDLQINSSDEGTKIIITLTHWL